MRSLIGAIRNSTPVSFGSKSLSFPFMQRNDAASQMAAMGNVGTLFAIVNRASTAVASAEWKLYRKTPRAKTERVEVTSHAVLDLWNNPNSFYTRQELVESIQQHIDLTGEGWLVVGRNPTFRTLPLELWVVRPDRMTPVPDPTAFLSGYVYSGPDGEKIPLQKDEVLQIRSPNPLDPYRGLGPVQSVMVDLDASRYSAEWNRNFFLNSAEPGGVVQFDKRLTDAEFDEFTSRWREQHQGVARAHRVAVLENGGQWVDRKFSQRDMQFEQLRNVSREIIREAFGFPKPMLGATDDINRANAEAAEYVFAKWFVAPRLDRIKGMLNSNLLPLYGTAARGLEFDYENPTPENTEAESVERTSKANAAKTLVDAGFDPAMVLECVGLPQMTHTMPPAPVPAATGGM